LALAFLATPPGQTVEEAKRRLEDLIDRYGAMWPVAWLDHCGLAAWAASLRQAMAVSPAPPAVCVAPPPLDALSCPLVPGVLSHVSTSDAGATVTRSDVRVAALEPVA
jgi:hypothetical protein